MKFLVSFRCPRSNLKTSLDSSYGYGYDISNLIAQCPPSTEVESGDYGHGVPCRQSSWRWSWPEEQKKSDAVSKVVSRIGVLLRVQAARERETKFRNGTEERLEK